MKIRRYTADFIRFSAGRGTALIDSWYQDGAYDSSATPQQNLAVYIQDLWDSSTLNAGADNP